MKKLMIIGSLLIVGALSYSAIDVELEENPTPPSPKTYSGKGRLPVASVGRSITGTGNGTLVITPTVSSGVDGNSLAFNFGNMLAGNTQTLVGKYEAVIIGEDGKPMKFDPSKVTSKLVHITGTTGKWSEDPGQDEIKDLAIHFGLDNKGSGSLTYKLNTKDSGRTHEGTVTAEVKINENDNYAGHFTDKSVRVKVTVASDWKVSTGVGA